MKVYKHAVFEDHRQVVNFLNSMPSISVVCVIPTSKYVYSHLVEELILIYTTEETNE